MKKIVPLYLIILSVNSFCEDEKQSDSFVEKISSGVKNGWDYVSNKFKRDNADIHTKLDRIEKSAEDDVERLEAKVKEGMAKEKVVIKKAEKKVDSILDELYQDSKKYFESNKEKLNAKVENTTKKISILAQEMAKVQARVNVITTDIHFLSELDKQLESKPQNNSVKKIRKEIQDLKKELLDVRELALRAHAELEDEVDELTKDTKKYSQKAKKDYRSTKIKVRELVDKSKTVLTQLEKRLM